MKKKDKFKVIAFGILIVSALVITILTLASKQSQVEAYLEYNRNRFVTIEQGSLDFLDYRIVYDKKTKVEYMITDYNDRLLGVTITPLYNQDGTLLTYRKK